MTAPSSVGPTSAPPGCVVWFTGPPCAGKTTLATMLQAEARRTRAAVEFLDGDEIRQAISPDLGFSEADRNANVRRIGYIANLLQRNGVLTIVALVSPYRSIRDEVRHGIANFVEVYVKCDQQECVRRDTKGMYKKALAGQIPNFTGVSAPYEPPLAPEVVVETDRMTPAECLSTIVAALRARGYVR